MTQNSPARPGGRSLRVKQAVFDAFESLLLAKPDELPTMTAIAAAAGVNPTSLYRRWGEVSALAADVAVERLMQAHPIPDTGSLRGDLTGWARAAAVSLSGPKNGALLRIMAGAARPGAAQAGHAQAGHAHAGAAMPDPRRLPIAPRLGEIETVLARARARGEIAPVIWTVLEVVLAPIYLRVLFLGPIADIDRYVDRLVGRLLALDEAA